MVSTHFNKNCPRQMEYPTTPDAKVNGSRNVLVQSIPNLKDTTVQNRCREYKIQEGFSISLFDVASENDLRLSFEKDQPMVNFGFVVCGNFTNRIKAPGLNSKGFSNQAGSAGILFLPKQDGCLTVPGNQRVCLVHVHLSPTAFHSLFYPDRENLPNGLQSMMEGHRNKAWHFRSGLSTHAGDCLNRLITGPAPGAPTHIFYQGIALELLADQIARANTTKAQVSGMSLDDQDRVVQARDLLVRDLSAPPCMKQLSRTTGLNMNKLQQGFRRLYGLSVFQYLQSFRIKEANRLFHETDMNVSQAAFAVGYTNVSHFSRAYKKHFNILPKKHLSCIKSI
nr:AraC family transcriptional regulator [uncultured Desulfobacter sp.]